MPDGPAADPDPRLCGLLGTEPPASVLNLSAPARAALADVLEDARRRQSESLEQAFAAALKHVPLPVRGIVKKALMG